MRWAALAVATAMVTLAGVGIVWHSRSATTVACSALTPTVVSLTPAGTDLLIDMGAWDHLIGVSNYDDDRMGVTGKPRVGDYDNIDWEKIGSLRPNVLLIQHDPARMPSAIKQKCQELGIHIVNLKIDTLDDIDHAFEVIGQALGESQKAKAAQTVLSGQLNAVREMTRGLPRVRALVVTSDDGMSLAGPGEFLDELLTAAGGANAAAKLDRPYPQVDREMLLSMSPDVIIQLIPDGDRAPQAVKQAKDFWASMPQLPAVKNDRVYILTEWYALVPGSRVGELAEQFKRLLHPEISATEVQP